MAELTVVSLNLLNDLTFWDLRAPLIVAELRRLNPDVIALQEVALPLNNAQWLAEQLGGYTVHLQPKTGARREHEALALLSRLPVTAPDGLELIHQDRVAQRITVRVGDAPLVIANTHLLAWLTDATPRREQVRRLLAWLPRDAPVIVCGDFNALPHFRAIKMMRARFVSAYFAAHGHEPAFTWPTPLDRGKGWRHRARELLLRLGGIALRRTPRWCGTLDYIFVDRALTVRACERAFTQPARDNPRLYPSDHLGLVARLNW
jgi:endonuclease/exonuclease/phosphatase family metal-dependent hydrolase